MLKVLNKINEPKDLKGLTIDELNTLAEENKENWHWTMPFDRETGKGVLLCQDIRSSPI